MADLLPPNATTLERNLATVNSRLSDIPILIGALMRPADCPSEFLPWLAQHLSVDSWEDDWTDAQKRASIQESLSVHRVKGTIGAVRRSLAALGFTVRLQEWFNQIPTGAPYTYRLLLEVDQVGISQEGMQRVEAVVAATKNLRSHLDKTVLTVTTGVRPMAAAVAGIGSEIVVGYGLPDVHLMIEGVVNGMEQTEAGVEALDTMLNKTMPTPNFW